MSLTHEFNFCYLSLVLLNIHFIIGGLFCDYVLLGWLVAHINNSILFKFVNIPTVTRLSHIELVGIRLLARIKETVTTHLALHCVAHNVLQIRRRF